MTEFTGRARKVGDDINTDYIISSARKRETLDASVLSRYVLEAIDPTFAASVRPGDILVAGRNFGCGSAMEVASTVILAAGIRVVVAQSFSRTFFRNAINNGLVPVEADTTLIQEGDRLTVTIRADGIVVTDAQREYVFTSAPLAAPVRAILDAGGIVAVLRGR